MVVRSGRIAGKQKRLAVAVAAAEPSALPPPLPSTRPSPRGGRWRVGRGGRLLADDSLLTASEEDRGVRRNPGPYIATVASSANHSDVLPTASTFCHCPPSLCPSPPVQVIERDEVLGQPLAVVGVESGIKFFVLVERVKRAASSKNMVVLRCGPNLTTHHLPHLAAPASGWVLKDLPPPLTPHTLPLLRPAGGCARAPTASSAPSPPTGRSGRQP